MRKSRLSRHLLATTLPVALLLTSGGQTALAEPMIGQGMNAYGLPGAIDTPTAEMLPDGTIGATVSYSEYGQRNTVMFQVLPRLSTALRYSRLDNIEDGDRDYVWDRSFDLRYQLLDENENSWQPALAVGLRDFMGTGLYSAQYMVASKTITPQLRVSAGVGWGRLGGTCYIPGGQGTTGDCELRDDIGNGGKPQPDDWFRGSAKAFGSISYQATDRLRIVAEYSPETYGLESAVGEEEPSSQINLGATYSFRDNYQLGLYTIGGKKFGAQFSVALNPRHAPYPSGIEPAPAPVRPRPAQNADPEGWSGVWASDPTAQPAIQTALGEALAGEGQQLESMALSANRAEVRIRNQRYIQHAEAIGRTARLMTRALPPSVETFVITTSAGGLPTSSVTLRRSDVERLENTEASKIASVAVLSDADPRPAGLVPTPGLYPRLQGGLRPYMSTSLFDPDEPFRYEIGARLSGEYAISPGLVLSGAIQQRVLGSTEQEGPGSQTPEEYLAQDEDVNARGVPRVRSDGRMYSGNNKPVIPNLTLTWYAKPTDQIYTRVTVGLLERAYGGVSAEALWKPVNSPLAFGAEVNRVRKRDFEDMFGFRDYEVTTGHVSAYYEFGDGFVGELEVGQYLAGDRGASVSVTREFANGWRVGAYATKTDMSEEDFGEGSFDKGVTISLPIGWATGQASKQRVGGIIRSLSRDGGSKLRVSGRLYNTVRESHSEKLYQGWGKFWR
ncbi:YjbH domain-containing protein [Paracoccus tegillarcae]|uniref:YjbH domain-containing protein n=1 Tax=Paracoccus tegillarcae TaxID=1529068 RepID=A0A2K9F405_9RHOB|nr:YjbH domain-containing protein [Paracoccus tegillarcae]AUH33861.1 YjbH domain-containing protein [Paracoccus tegillarcae]